mgnify:CR=1 FL=1
MPLIPNLSLYLIQKFDRLALWGNLTILELHYAETQVNEIASYGDVPRAAVIYMAAPKINTISAGSRIQMRTGMDSKKCAGKILL